jgi:hypothetical protein
MSTDATAVVMKRMTERLRAGAPKALAANAPCDPGFRLDAFAVTYPNNELIANVSVTAVPQGATLLGVTIAATPSQSSDTVYCMGVAADAAGLTVPVSVLAASMSPSFASPTTVTGTVVLSYSLGGSSQECEISQQFTVGG